jgi:hypothetical protein
MYVNLDSLELADCLSLGSLIIGVSSLIGTLGAIWIAAKEYAKDREKDRQIKQFEMDLKLEEQERDDCFKIWERIYFCQRIGITWRNMGLAYRNSTDRYSTPPQIRPEEIDKSEIQRLKEECLDFYYKLIGFITIEQSDCILWYNSEISNIKKWSYHDISVLDNFITQCLLLISDIEKRFTQELNEKQNHYAKQKLLISKFNVSI